MRLKIKLAVALWVMAFCVCALTVDAMGAVYWTSFAVLCAVSLHMERHAKQYDADCDDTSDELV